MKDYYKKHEVTRPETAEQIQDLANTDYAIEFPIDLNLDSMIHIRLPEIKWKNFGSTPSSMKISNTGKSVILTTHWADKKRPCISGGPLLGNYAFSQLHFLWSRKDYRGGKHTYNRKTFPLEIHALFYKCEYGNRAQALRHKDGAVVLVFASKLDKVGDTAIDSVCGNLSGLSDGTSCSVQVEPPIKISDLIHRFTADYFLYWGTIATTSCNHLLLWLVCRTPFHISQSQIHHFRRLMTAKQNHIINNSQSIARIHPHFKRVFHINPSKYHDDVLYRADTPRHNMLPRKDYNKMKGGLRPSSTAGVRCTRSELQSSIYRPATAAGVGTSRGGDSKSIRSLTGRESSRGRLKNINHKEKESGNCNGNVKNKIGKPGIIRSKSVSTHKNLKNNNIPTFGISVNDGKNVGEKNVNYKDKESGNCNGSVKNKIGKPGMIRSKSVSTHKNLKNKNILTFGICVNDGQNVGEKNVNSKEKEFGSYNGNVKNTIGKPGMIRSKSVSAHKNLKGNNIPTFGICVNDSKIVGGEDRRSHERRNMNDYAQRDTDRLVNTKENREGSCGDGNQLSEVNRNVLGGKEMQLAEPGTRRELNGNKISEETKNVGKETQLVTDICSNKIEVQECDQVEQIFINKMGGLKGFRRELETIYSEGSEQSVVQDFIQNNNSRIESHPSTYFGNDTDCIQNNVQIESYPKYLGNDLCDELESSDRLSQKSEKARKTRSCFTASSSSNEANLSRLASIKDSLEMIRQSFVKNELGVDDVIKERTGGENAIDENEEKVDDKLKLESKAQLSSVDPVAPLSKKQKLKNFLNIKSRNVVRKEKSEKTEKISPPRWRY